jgi:hypothetical protein
MQKLHGITPPKRTVDILSSYDAMEGLRKGRTATDLANILIQNDLGNGQTTKTVASYVRACLDPDKATSFKPIELDILQLETGNHDRFEWTCLLLGREIPAVLDTSQLVLEKEWELAELTKKLESVKASLAILRTPSVARANRLCIVR